VSCFGDSAGAPTIWSSLATTISQRNKELKTQLEAGVQSGLETSQKRRSHTRELLLDRNLRLKKIGEESAELIASCADGDVSRATEEAADLIYHVGVALEAIGSSLDGVAEILWERSVSPPKTSA
jgi:phosphoribosyl-ATP pyrophosphohydrolase/phosphoribosyl-AMP cyclohydrolase